MGPSTEAVNSAKIAGSSFVPMTPAMRAKTWPSGFRGFLPASSVGSHDWAYSPPGPNLHSGTSASSEKRLASMTGPSAQRSTGDGSSRPAKILIGMRPPRTRTKTEQNAILSKSRSPNARTARLCDQETKACGGKGAWATFKKEEKSEKKDFPVEK